MLKKTIAATAIGIGSLAAIAAPASAAPDQEPGDTGQVGLVNIDDSLNNVCLLPWNDGNVLLLAHVPVLSPNDYQACGEGVNVAP